MEASASVWRFSRPYYVEICQDPFSILSNFFFLEPELGFVFNPSIPLSLLFDRSSIRHPEDHFTYSGEDGAFYGSGWFPRDDRSRPRVR